MTRRQFAGGAARTTLTGSIASTGGGTVTIAATTGWPDGSVGRFHVVVDPGLSSEEKILVDSRSGTTLTFSAGGRGADGSTATSHSSGADIWICYTAVDADEANDHINKATGAHTAAQISYAPAGSIAATTVQGAIAELESENDTRVDLIEARADAIEAANWVTQTRMADASVGTAELIDANVTPAKYAPTTVLVMSRAANQSIAGGATDFITFDTETTDPTGMCNTGSPTVTVQAASAGLLHFDFIATPGTAPTAQFAIIQVNETPQRRYVSGPSSSATGIACSITVRLVATSTVNFYITNGAGGAINYTATLRVTRLAA